MTGPYDKLGRALAATGLVAQRLLAPRCLRRGAVVLAAANTMTATVTTAVRVVGGVHDDTADRRTLAFVAVAASFTDLDVLVLLVANNTEGSRAILIDQTDFTTW